MRFADMDGDGATDWILTRPDKIIVQLRDRDGALRATSTFPDAAGDDLYVRQMAVADVTGDGQLDLVVRDEHSVFVVQQSSGNLALLGPLDVTPSSQELLLLSAGHFISQSQADIVVETGPGELRLFHFSGGAFSSAQALTDVAVLERSVAHRHPMAAWDVDGDGLHDLLYPTADGLAVARRTAAGDFQPVHRLALDGSYELGAFGDFDGNGLQDVAVIARIPGSSGDGATRLHTWLQGAAGTFTALAPQDRERGRGGILVADLSDDGGDEVVIGASVGRLREGRWLFTERDSFEDTPAGLIDLTGDGLLDLVNAGGIPSFSRGVRADLALDVVEPPGPVRAGGSVSMTLSVTNRGPSAAGRVALLAESGENGQVTLRCGLEDCSRLELDAGQSLVFSAALSVGEGEHVDLGVSACGSLFDADTSNNRASLRVPIDNEERADLSGHVSIMVDGAELTLPLSVVNSGPSPARRVILEQQLPADMSRVSWTSSRDADCALEGTTLSCQLAELPEGEIWSLTPRGGIDYRQQRIETRVTVRSDTADPDESDNTFGRVMPEGFLGAIPGFGAGSDGDASGGCGCRLGAPPSSATPPALALAAVAALAVAARRRGDRRA
ncbi:FG-GAP-like repeat-containing protein [Sorangium sp. So ce341]|uniref:FG-GAP-like repeat-containing protein n=1 Tax=Sorangium sp. So ce341 TaxID=3133302 RepID=UPI003F61E279